MNTLVMNLTTLGVTEYDAACTGISGDFEASSEGLFKLAETPDPRRASWAFGLQLEKEGRQQRPKYLYLFGQGLDGIEADVADTRGNTYTYPLNMRHDNVGRIQFGQGIRDNYLQVTVARESTEPLLIDRLELDMLTSSTRRL